MEFCLPTPKACVTFWNQCLTKRCAALYWGRPTVSYPERSRASRSMSYFERAGAMGRTSRHASGGAARQAAIARGCWRVGRHRSGQDDQARLLSGFHWERERLGTVLLHLWAATLSLWSGSRHTRSRGGPRLRRRRPAAQRAMPACLEWRDAATESVGVPFADRWRQWKVFFFSRIGPCGGPAHAASQTSRRGSRVAR